MPRTLVDKIWDQHVVAELGSSLDLLHIDRTLGHDLGGACVFGALHEQGATVDHCHPHSLPFRAISLNGSRLPLCISRHNNTCRWATPPPRVATLARNVNT